MVFAELLRQYKGNKTLDEIASECANRGVRTCQVTLSRMCTGKRLPPKDEATIRAIAEACGRDPEPLILAAKVARNPESILHEIVRLVAPFVGEAAEKMTADERIQTEAELVGRLSEVSGVPVGAITASLQVLKSLSGHRARKGIDRDQNEEE